MPLHSALRLAFVAALVAAGDAADAHSIQALQEKLVKARADVRAAESELAAALLEQQANDLSLSDAGFSGGAAVTTMTAATCKARLWSRDTSRLAQAANWTSREYSARAPYYLKSARRSFERGLLQKTGKDKSNSDPFIKQYEGFNQVAGALDLAPEDPEIWLGAGKVTIALGSLLPEETELAQSHALSFFARACRMQPSLLSGLIAWCQEKGDKSIKKDEITLRKRVLKLVSKWESTGEVPELSVSAIPSLDEGTCKLKAGNALSFKVDQIDSQVQDVVQALEFRSIFPTRVASINVKAFLPEGFIERLATLCIDKYTDFGRQRPELDPNDLNDQFFSYQVTDERALQSPKAQKRWPEMYRDSADFKLLVKVMGAALRSYAQQSGVQGLPSDEEEYHTVLWAAVYPGNGGRHGYHVHQGSLSSCVLYLKTAGATTPMTFVDPRGAPPVNDYEQHLKERDFEPVAPFHHGEYFFPEAGDLVCFPSWLVHNVPSHWEKVHRVAIASNLQGSAAWDSWMRTVTSWS